MAVGQHGRRRERAHEEVGGVVRDRFDLVVAGGEEDARVVGDRRLGEVVDVGPVVAGLGLEARALEPDDRHAGELRVGRDARGERVRGVDDAS